MKHDQIMSAVQNELQGSNVKLLANYSGLSKTCIYRIKNAKTKWPRGSTMDTLLDSLKLELVVRKKK